MTPDPKVKTRTRTAEQKKADAASQRARRAAAKLAAPPVPQPIAEGDDEAYDAAGRPDAGDEIAAPQADLMWKDEGDYYAIIGVSDAGRAWLAAHDESVVRVIQCGPNGAPLGAVPALARSLPATAAACAPLVLTDDLGIGRVQPKRQSATRPPAATALQAAPSAAAPQAGRQRIDAAFEERFRALHAEGKTMRQMQEALGYKGTLYSLHRRFGLAPNRAPKA